jgi:hypothetical protein
VTTHVFDTSSGDDVLLADADGPRSRGDCCHRSGAHAVYRKTGNGLGKPSQKCHSTAKRQTLIALLGGGGNCNVVDSFWWKLGVAAQKFAQRFDCEVICSGVGVVAIWFGFTKGGAYPIDKHYVPG